MNLPSRIPHNLCPHCAAAVDSQSFGFLHCNGQWDEYVVYRCGYKLHWSPNYEQLLVEEKCPSTAEGKEDRRKEELIRFIEDKMYWGGRARELPLETLEKIYELAVEKDNQ